MGVIVALNKFKTDTDAELAKVIELSLAAGASGMNVLEAFGYPLSADTDYFY